MNDDNNKKIEQAARALAEYASYSEIVGGISVNRSQIRKYCDIIFELTRQEKNI